MSICRRFLVASSLARLIGRERDGERVAEGYFPDQAGRALHVRIANGSGRLVLVDAHPEVSGEELADLPLTQAEALLDLTTGQVGYVETPLQVDGHTISLDRFTTPGPLDLVSVAFASPAEAQAFTPLTWFGPEVTQDPAYRTRSIALDGAPAVPEVPLANGVLDSLLDDLQSPSDREQETFLLQEPQRSSEVATAAQAGFEDEDAAGLAIEDDVIRELARSLRPQR